jgi:hypothetical protein
MAKGNDAPLRIIEGEKTLLAEAQGLAVDSKNQLLYVSNQGAFARAPNDKDGAGLWLRVPRHGRFPTGSST